MMPLKNKNSRKSYNNTSPPSCPRQPFSSIFTKKNINNNNKKRPSSFSGAVRVKNYVVHLSTSTPVIIARTHTIKLLHICGLISDKMCHFSDKMLSFCDKTKEVQAENCAAAAEVRRPYLSRTHPSLKKKKILKITSTTTIILLYYLVSDIWQKMQKNKYGFSTQNIVQNICV